MVRGTVEHDLPREIDYLRLHDEAVCRIIDRVEMANRLAENSIMLIRQNNGFSPVNGEFQKLRDDELRLIEF